MLAATAVTVRLEGKIVFEDVRFGALPGSTIAIVGPCGSGKTVLLETLLGIHPFDGWIQLDGADLVDHPRRARSVVAFVPAQPAFACVGLREHLEFIASLHGVDRDRVGPVLAATGLLSRADAPIRSLPTGMQRRVSLAAAFVSRARVVLMDEPLAGLDEETRDVFLRLSRAHTAGGGVIVLATSREEDALAFGARVLHLDGGRLYLPEQTIPNSAGGAGAESEPEAPDSATPPRRSNVIPFRRGRAS